MLVFRIDKMVSSNKHIKVYRLMHRIPIEETELVQPSAQSNELKLVLDFLPGAVHLMACGCLHLHTNPPQIQNMHAKVLTIKPFFRCSSCFQFILFSQSLHNWNLHPFHITGVAHNPQTYCVFRTYTSGLNQGLHLDPMRTLQVKPPEINLE